MELLPIELYDNIFKYLVYDHVSVLEDIRRLHRLSLVCHKWKQLVESMVTEIHITQCFKGNQNVFKTINLLNQVLINNNNNIKNNSSNNKNNNSNNNNNKIIPLFKRLKVIQICIGLSDDTITHLSTLLSSYKSIATTINLSKNNLGSNSIKSLKRLIVNDYCPTTSSCCRKIKDDDQDEKDDDNWSNRGVHWKPIKLILAGNGIGLQGARRLSKYLSSRLCNLVEMDLSNNKLNDNGTKMLMMALVNNQSLESINLSGNNIGKDSVVFLKEVFKYNQNIKFMDLSFNWIQEGSYQLLHFLFYNRLRRRNQVSLNLNYNKIQEVGIQQINKLFVELCNILSYGIFPSSLEDGGRSISSGIGIGGGGGVGVDIVDHRNGKCDQIFYSNNNYYHHINNFDNHHHNRYSSFPPIFPIDRLDIYGNDCEVDTTKTVYSNLANLRTQYDHMLLKVSSNKEVVGR